MRPLPMRLLAISDRASLARLRPGLAVEAWAEELDTLGVDALQLRERDLSDRALFELASAVRSRFRGLLLINARADIALAAGADGVHLPEAGLPVGSLRRLYTGRLLLGRSVHSLTGVREARRAGADYVTLSPIFQSPGKGTPLGPGILERAAAEGLPVLALGGLDVERLAEVARRGAHGAAAIRLFQSPEATRRAVARAAELWHRLPPARGSRFR